ncbi:lipid A deacylase LpxR family protein [Mucilaginibacter segetis]|uniref:Lipid A deacylase LpxR family protein n=1 Tax=Mucilaginibacter segetis TaxID=2793071 RepID=A0A934PPD5_9SPHI|nr:lipid A deacylase LpxR family protein [Mucilaginibacter segetis]MBK0378259.1 lipid A deacylase LpxR family protein [Mucilaginibacter segetis]
MKIKLLMLCLFIAGAVQAQSHTDELGIQADNDSFLAQGSDRYYTNGIFIYYRHALDVGKNGNTSLLNKVLGFEAGQKIYNAQSGNIPSLNYLDRPFAGYLYIGSSLNLLYNNESSLKLGAKIGVVGPAAGGEPVQNFIHDTFGFYNLNGWQYQVRNDVELNLSADYTKLISREAWADISVNAYGNLGNGFTGAGIGPLLRLGNFNQFFRSVSTQSTAIKNDNIAPLHPRELFFYYKPLINLVAYDATVQGNLFKSHPEPNTQEVTGEINPLVFSQQVGVSYAGSRFIFDLSAVFDTKEVKGMAKRHQWGSATVLYRFN